ncbi:MAG: hypothetical protein ACRDRS_03695 [Pseudonocardiaceae bacterium]
MSESRRSGDVERLLERQAGNGASTTGQELVFDPTTGQLVVTNQPSPDAVLATPTAEDGFFGSRFRR